ncbi:hypothetical protein [Bacillus sp. PK3_68]|uniref:hypothetical protein n=1 Tax=Bacillus sp. PK3_68 TaxID=2027408 RepID=UPI000E7207EA|nr:hypothetical protein [Bacillus sp. PK3_68]RJS60157.1 hypothetical protein CJ483_08835 [Bacillus sp. PK3_68]
MLSEFEIKRAKKLRQKALKNPVKRELIRIPVFERVYIKDGELYGELVGDKTPRKVSECTVESRLSKGD